MKQRKLDRTKPYGEIWGDDPNIPKGARFEQNKMYFNQQGEYLAGNYEPADEKDIARDALDENAALKATNAEKDGEIARLRAQLGGGEVAAAGAVVGAAEERQPDTAAANTEQRGAAATDDSGLNREEIIAGLKARNVSFPKKATTRQLYDILQNEMNLQADAANA